MKDVLIVNSETEDLLDNFKIENDEELVIQKQSKKLTPKQKRLINRKNDLKKYCNKQGGFVHMFYVNKKLLFYDLDIDRANIARIIYLATYIDYNDRKENLLILHKKNNKVEHMTKKEIQQKLGLKRDAFLAFLNDVKKHNLIFEVEEKFYLNPKYFSKGENFYKNKEYVRIMINTTRYLYEHTTIRQHKTLSYVFQLIPYANWKLNILCKNPLEIDIGRLDKLSLKDICELLGLSTKQNSMYLFRDSLRKFHIKVDGHKYYLFAYSKVYAGEKTKDYYIINPLVIWGGNNTEEIKEIINYCFFK
jgi:hypothetical protein|nr:MAG TPA: Transcription Factor [Caudoviricetes sp.]